MKWLVILAGVVLALAAGSAWADRIGPAHGGWHGGAAVPHVQGWAGHEHHDWHHHHHHGGGGFLIFGAPLFWPGYDPSFTAPAPVVVEPPPAYVERDDAETAGTDRFWYYCDAAGAYYPYVKECPGGWRTVVPQ
jgi:hypothetical protein